MAVPKAGALAKASDWTTVFPLDTDAWTPYTPTLTQSATVTKTIVYARYMKVGRWVRAQFYMTVTGAGTAANAVLVGLPVPAVQAGDMSCGTGFLVDASAGLPYASVALINSASIVYFWSTTNAGFLGVASFTAALAAGDSVRGEVSYESAT